LIKFKSDRFWVFLIKVDSNLTGKFFCRGSFRLLQILPLDESHCQLPEVPGDRALVGIHFEIVVIRYNRLDERSCQILSKKHFKTLPNKPQLKHKKNM
jgi:hypothetical protein